MRAFRSKISVGLTIFILAVLLLVALPLLQFADSTANLIITSAVLALTAALCLIPLFSIRYVVDGQMLHIECCFVFRSPIQHHGHQGNFRHANLSQRACGFARQNPAAIPQRWRFDHFPNRQARIYPAPLPNKSRNNRQVNANCSD